jgi:hypothetical protein
VISVRNLLFSKIYDSGKTSHFRKPQAKPRHFPTKLLTWSFPTVFNLIPDKEKALKEVVRVLKPH